MRVGGVAGCRFPTAVCNDGSPGAFYFKKAPGVCRALRCSAKTAVFREGCAGREGAREGAREGGNKKEEGAELGG
eukprot:2645339-Rhodomonas_salina.3